MTAFFRSGARMNSLSLAALAVALPMLAACGCTQEARATAPVKAAPAKAAAPAPERTKAEAPVEIAADLGERSATVTVRFTAAASGVRIDVSGAAGLAVQGEPTFVDGASYEPGAEAVFDVAFTPGPGRSHLAVAVSGTFAGSHRAKVRSFAVGTPSPEQRKANGLTVETPGGDRVKVVIPGQ